MRFLLDESADFPLCAHLKQHGHDATAIVHDYPAALADHEVLAIARRERRIVITNDHDFGALVFQQRHPHTGVILFRLGEESIPTKIAWLDHVLTNFSDALADFVVVSERGVRIRRTADV